MKKVLFIVLALVGLFIWIGSRSDNNSSNSRSSPTGDNARTAPKVAVNTPAPKVTPAPKATPDPNPASKIIPDPVKVAVEPAKVAALRPLDERIRNAEVAYEVAKNTALRAAADQIRAAEAEASKAQDEVERARSGGNQKELVAASLRALEARNKARDMREGAVSGDAKAKAADAELQKLKAEKAAIEKSAAAEAASKQATEEAEKARLRSIVEPVERLMAMGIVTKVEVESRQVRVDLTRWLTLDRDQKASVIGICGRYMKETCGSWRVSVLSNRNDTEFASMNGAGEIVVKF